MRYADSLGFLVPQNEAVKPPFDLNHLAGLVGEDLLIHITVAPPVPIEPLGFNLDMNSIRYHVSHWSGACQAMGIEIIRTADDLKHPGLKVVFGLQHPPLDAGIEDLAELRDMGVVFSTIAYDAANKFGGGFSSDQGLTGHGHDLLYRMMHAGMILDLSHANEKTALEAAKFASTNCGGKLSICLTHSACRNVYDHPRNASDEVLWAVGRQGGYVGVIALSFCLSAEGNALDDINRHLIHAISLVGWKNVGMGTDGIYKELSEKESKALFEMLNRTVNQSGSFAPRFPTEADDLNTPWKMSRVEAHLHRSGFVSGFVPGLVGGNFLDFLRRSL